MVGTPMVGTPVVETPVVETPVAAMSDGGAAARRRGSRHRRYGSDRPSRPPNPEGPIRAHLSAGVDMPGLDRFLEQSVIDPGLRRVGQCKG